jgi:hypothetical protein
MKKLNRESPDISNHDNFKKRGVQWKMDMR